MNMKTRVLIIAALSALGAGAAEPLAPAEFEPLPAGSIRPEGWLGRNLDLQAEGLIGRLYETSPFLCPSNQWLNHKSGTYCWEEGPYWARTFVKLAALTRNPRLLKEAEKWMRAQADQQLADGWYGRSANERKSRQGPEVFSHIIMNEAILTWYEYTKDARYLELLRRFIDCLDDLPESALLSYSSANAPKPESTPQDWERALQGEGTTPDLYYWHRIRGGDLFKVLFRVHALTGDERYLEAVSHFENLYFTLKEYMLTPESTGLRDMFFDVCYHLGFCYMEISNPIRAYYFLDIAVGSGNIKHVMEHINVLANTGDARGLASIDRLEQNVQEMLKNDNDADVDKWNNLLEFLKRRKGFLFIEFNMLDEAEELFTSLLDHPNSHDYAIHELAHIKRLKEAQGNP